MSGVNKTRFLVRLESCECICRLNESLCNSKQKGNCGGCWCVCKELDDWGFCEKVYMWNPGTSDCECSKTCKIDESLDTKNCSCEKRLICKLVLGCNDEILNTTKTSPDDEKIT